MYPLLELIFRPNSVEYADVSLVLTMIQKFICIFLLVATAIDGFLFSELCFYLLPEKPPRRWFSFLLNGNVDGCNDVVSVFYEHQCIRSLVLKDLAETRDPALVLPIFSKFLYLTILRITHALTPWAFQISFLAVPSFVLMLAAWLVLRRFGGAQLVKKAGKLVRATGSVLPNRTLTTVVCMVLGILVLSSVACLVTTDSLDGIFDSCRGPTCLYCLPRFVSTIFRPGFEGSSAALSDPSRLLIGISKLVCSALLTVFLYVASVVTSCFVLYLLTDSIACFCDTLQVVVKYIFNRGSGAKTWIASHKDIMSGIKRKTVTFSNG